MTRAARRRLPQGALARDENERGIVTVALDAVEEEFRGFDRIEPAFRDEAPNLGGGLLFQIVDHVAGASVRAEPTAVVDLGKRTIDAGPRNNGHCPRPRRETLEA